MHRATEFEGQIKHSRECVIQLLQTEVQQLQDVMRYIDNGTYERTIEV